MYLKEVIESLLAVLATAEDFEIKHNGDKLVGGRFQSHAWSALRILRVIGIESEDDEEIGIAAGKADNIAGEISEALKLVARSRGANVFHGQRLCRCQKDIELGKLALRLGKKFWVPLINGRYSGKGPSERAMLRTFFLSQEREHVVTLEFEIQTERAEQSKGFVGSRKAIVELDDQWVSLEEDIDSQGITVDNGGD
nr:hypothetical protein LTR18_002307 [Exophiala xenobiotica]